MNNAQYKIIYSSDHINDPFVLYKFFFDEHRAFKAAKTIINYSWVHRLELWKNDRRMLLAVH